MKEEKILILKMLEEGKITSEEAIKLIEAIEEPEKKAFIDEDTKETIKTNLSETADTIGSVFDDIMSEVSKGLSNLSNMNKGFSFDKYKNNENKSFDFLVRDAANFNIENPLGSIRFIGEERENIYIVARSKSNKELDYKADKYFDLELVDQTINFSSSSKEILIDLEIYIPNRPMGDFSLRAIDGGISLENIELDSAILRGNTKSLEVNQVKAKDLRLYNQHGAIAINSSELEDLNAENMNGSIKLEATSLIESSLENINGSIRLDENKMEKLKLVSKNGSIRLMDNSIKNQEIENMNGSVRLELTSPARFKLASSNGSIKVNEDRMTIIEESITPMDGRTLLATSLDYDQSLEDKQVSIKTDNGSITVQVK